jgi:hypothetical protein
MPLKEFKCPNGHITEQYFPTRESIPERSQCETCPKSARAITFSRTFHKVEFGAAYGYAGPSDRRAWVGANDIQGWTGPEHNERKRGGSVKPARDRLK